MTSQEHEPRLGSECFWCPHCDAVAHQDWFSLFLKPENATGVLVLTLETLMLAKGNESDQFLQHLKDNVLAYEYQEHPRNLKVKLLNLHVSRCDNCKGFTVWVRDRLVFPIKVEEAPPDIVEVDFEEVANDVQGTVENVQESDEHVQTNAEDGEEASEDFEEAAAILNKFPRGAAALTRVCIQNMMPLLEQTGKNLDENISSLVRKGLEVEIQQAMDVLQVVRKSPLQTTEFDLTEENETAKQFFNSLERILKRRMLKKPGEK
jgi:thiol-disulfide isomerase/thioredoxin